MAAPSCERSVNVHMACFGQFLNNPPMQRKMRLAELATVSNFELLKPPHVGVTADSVIRLFWSFFCFQMACT